LSKDISQTVNFRELRYEANRPSRFYWFGLRSGFLFLCLAVRNIGLGLSLGALLGVAQIFAFCYLTGDLAIDRAMTCAALGLPFHLSHSVLNRSALCA